MLTEGPTGNGRTTTYACGLVATLAVILLVAFMPHAMARADAVDQAVEAVYLSGDYQRELPAPYVPETGKALDIDLPEIRLPADVMLLAFYAILAAFAIFAIIILFMLLSGVRFPAFNKAMRDDGSADERAGAADVPDTTEGWLSAADELARDGRYGEAVHALLLAVLTRLRERATMTWRSSTTAREIVSQSNLNSKQEGLLGLLVRAAELAHFGGRNADRDEFSRCRESALALLDSVPGGLA